MFGKKKKSSKYGNFLDDDERDGTPPHSPILQQPPQPVTPKSKQGIADDSFRGDRLHTAQPSPSAALTANLPPPPIKRPLSLSMSSPREAIGAPLDVYTWGGFSKDTFSKYSKATGMGEFGRLPSLCLKGHFVEVVSGLDFILARTVDGQLYSWGSNTHGQLGSTNSPQSWLPGCVGELVGKKVTRLAAGPRFAACLTHEDVYLWGGIHKKPGCFGYEPTSMLTKDCVDISCGEAHVVVLTSRGNVYTFGANGSFQLGNGAQTDNWGSFERVDDVLGACKAVRAGSFCCAALSERGRIYIWGGDGSILGKWGKIPTALSANVGFSEILVGSQHFVALSEDRVVHTLGCNDVGQLGHSGSQAIGRAEIEPVAVYELRNFRMAKVSTTGGNVVCLTEEGEVFCWGGLKTSLDQSGGQFGRSPTKLNGSYVDVAAGIAHMVALNRAGCVYVWGYGDLYQLGNGLRTPPTFMPQEVMHCPSAVRIDSMNDLTIAFCPLSEDTVVDSEQRMFPGDNQ